MALPVANGPGINVLTSGKIADFRGAGTVTKMRVPAGVKVINLEDPITCSQKNFMLFGPPGSGKSYVGAQIASMGYRILYICTDMGGTNTITSTVVPALNAMKKRQYWPKNFRVIDLNVPENSTEDPVEYVLNHPEHLVPDIWEFDPDFLFWEGFSNYQNVMLRRLYGTMTSGSKAENVPEARQYGTGLEIRDYDYIKSNSIQNLDKFLRLNNPNGKAIHKIVSFHEDVKKVVKQASRAEGGGFQTTMVDQNTPMLMGASSVICAAGFDFVFKTSADPIPGNQTQNKYTYLTGPQDNAIAKSRGLTFPAEIPADFCAVWKRICDEFGLTYGRPE